MKRWYLSFAGDEGFRGACIVRALDFLSAVQECNRLNINPHGEVRALEIPDDAESPHAENVLLSLADLGDVVKWP